MMEHWKEAPGWEGLYEVSNQGRVRSVARTATFSDGRVRHIPSTLRSAHKDGFGYLKMTLKHKGVQKRVLVHQLVAAAWIGPRPKGYDVCHTDGDKVNNRVENLRYDTRAANRADSVKHGTSVRPSMRKLTDDQVAEIRELRGAVPLAELAARFNTSKTHVCNIQLGNRRAV